MCRRRSRELLITRPAVAGHLCAHSPHSAFTARSLAFVSSTICCHVADMPVSMLANAAWVWKDSANACPASRRLASSDGSATAVSSIWAPLTMAIRAKAISPPGAVSIWEARTASRYLSQNCTFAAALSPVEYVATGGAGRLRLMRTPAIATTAVAIRPMVSAAIGRPLGRPGGGAGQGGGVIVTVRMVARDAILRLHPG